jgi:hypothetical protein
MTTKKDVASVTTEIYALLEPLSADERQRAITATQALLGSSLTPMAAPQAPVGTGLSSLPGMGAPVSAGSAQQFFAHKQPQSPAELLAVAARYRELSQSAMEHVKDDFKAVYKDARRSFDATHFARDVGNARARGFFTRGKEITLADYGQKFVDALPDRAAADALKKPAAKKRKKKAGT